MRFQQDKLLFLLLMLIVFHPLYVFGSRECSKSKDPDHVAACEYFLSLPLDEQQDMQRLKKLVKQSKASLISLLPARTESADKPIIVLVDGFDFKGFEFFPTFQFLKTEGFETYFFKWSKFRSMKTNVARFKKAISSLSIVNTSRKIVVFAYCAGGIVALRGFSDLQHEQLLPPQVSLHTIASPVGGFGAPKNFNFFAIPFIGSSGISIGIGQKGMLHGQQTRQCEEWITTNCDLDEIACRIRNVYPQQLDPRPCGSENLHELSDQTHFTALFTVLTTVLSRYP